MAQRIGGAALAAEHQAAQRVIGGAGGEVATGQAQVAGGGVVDRAVDGRAKDGAHGVGGGGRGRDVDTVGDGEGNAALIGIAGIAAAEGDGPGNVGHLGAGDAAGQRDGERAAVAAAAKAANGGGSARDGVGDAAAGHRDDMAVAQGHAGHRQHVVGRIASGQRGAQRSATQGGNGSGAVEIVDADAAIHHLRGLADDVGRRGVGGGNGGGVVRQHVDGLQCRDAKAIGGLDDEAVIAQGIGRVADHAAAGVDAGRAVAGNGGDAVTDAAHTMAGLGRQGERRRGVDGFRVIAAEHRAAIGRDRDRAGGGRSPIRLFHGSRDRVSSVGQGIVPDAPSAVAVDGGGADLVDTVKHVKRRARIGAAGGARNGAAGRIA